MLKFLNVEDIAIAAQAAEFGYFYSPNSAPSTWNKTGNEQKTLLKEQVVFIIKNPNADPAELHGYWVNQMKKLGWSFGSYDEENKQHPYILEYEDMPDAAKPLAGIFLSTAKSLGHLVDPVELALYDTVK